MLPLIGAGIGAAADIVGGIVQNKANAKQAQLNRDFQERMSSTAFQRGVKDLQAAGLNPALAYGSAQASSPSGGVGAPQQNVASGAVSTALSAANLQLMKAQVAATLAGARKANADAAVTESTSGAQPGIASGQIAQLTANAAEIWKRVENLDLDMSQKRERFATELKKLVTDIKVGESVSSLNLAGLPAATAKGALYNSEFGKQWLPWIEKMLELFTKVK